MKIFQGFFGVFFFFALGFILRGAPAFGHPLTERLLSISKSSSDKSKIALNPMYLIALYSARSNLLRTASTDTTFFGVLIFWQISNTVNSISLLYRHIYRNQGEKCQKDGHLDIYKVGQNDTLNCGVLTHKKFIVFFLKPLTILLDGLFCKCRIVEMSNRPPIRHIRVGIMTHCTVSK